MDQANILIIGGGVVGCAIARAVSARWEDVFLVEQNPKLGMATSSRNSGVVHSGIYYPKNSLKARHCIEGNRLTYEFCKKHNVPFRHTGKLVVAANAHEEVDLEALKKKGEDNGVEGLRIIGPEEIRKREPHIRGSAAMVVPSTGIVSAEELVHAYARIATGQGAEIVTHARVVSLEPIGGAIRVGLRIGDEEDVQDETIEARCVINAAGLYADEVAGLLGNNIVEDLSRARGVLRGARAAGFLDQRSRLSPAAPRWAESRRAFHEDICGERFCSVLPRLTWMEKKTTRKTGCRLRLLPKARRRFCRRLKRATCILAIRGCGQSWCHLRAMVLRIL